MAVFRRKLNRLFSITMASVQLRVSALFKRLLASYSLRPMEPAGMAMYSAAVPLFHARPEATSMAADRCGRSAGR